MAAGLLLARQGAQVLVLEKHGHFLRDFRGAPRCPFTKLEPNGHTDSGAGTSTSSTPRR
jgi:2-polyprenyl-6-methoxyphenol hydroxylase-like FAD-dependent oxidoreductase